MIIKRSLEKTWIESGNEPRRMMTFEECIEFICENCQNATQEIELTINDECIAICKECAKQIVNNKLSNPNFIDNIKLVIM